MRFVYNLLDALKMKKLILLLCLLPIGLLAQGDDSLRFSHKNSIQLELGGNGGFYSFLYERIFLNGNKFKTSVQVGVAYYPPSTGIIDLWIPVLINEIFSINRQHHIELGLGYSFNYEASRDSDNNPSNWRWGGFYTGRFGYRYHFPNEKLILRVAFTPFLEYSDGYLGGFHPSGGAAIGYCF